MLRLALQRLLMCLAFATALVAPAIARAAILPACENDVLTELPFQAAVEAAAEDCAAADQVGDTYVAAMCDARGASVVAPGRILPIADSHLDAVPGCGPGEGPSCAVGPAPQDSPLSHGAVALNEHAMLGSFEVPPPLVSGLAPPYPAPRGGPRAGVRAAVDHPPHG